MQPTSKPRKSCRFYGIDWVFFILMPLHVIQFALEIKHNNIEAAWAWLNLLFLDTGFWLSARLWRRERKELNKQKNR